MKEKNKFRYAEKCLYEYKKNLARLDVLCEDLRVLQCSSDVKVQRYDRIFSTNGCPSDPVFNHIVKIESIEEEIQKIKRLTDPIDRMIRDFSAPEVLKNSYQNKLLEILRYVYFGNNSWRDVAQEMHIGKSLFFHYKNELVKCAIDYLGL